MSYFTFLGHPMNLKRCLSFLVVCVFTFFLALVPTSFYGLNPETGLPIGHEDYVPTYEEWKASLGVGPQEFPHTLIGTDQPLDYVNRLIREHEMFQEMVMSQMDQY